MDPLEHSGWTAKRFFDLLSRLGRLRIISVCGPSVFEALCEVGPAVERDGFLNIMTDAYHWHFSPGKFRSLRSIDALHKRSNRRAVYFELFEDASCEGVPFLRIYLFRPQGEDFCPDALAAFEAAHKELSEGIRLDGVPQ